MNYLKKLWKRIVALHFARKVKHVASKDADQFLADLARVLDVDPATLPKTQVDVPKHVDVKLEDK